MNVHLREVICTSKDGDRFWRVRECYIRGNTVKYMRVQEQVMDKAVEEQKRFRRFGQGRGKKKKRKKIHTSARRNTEASYRYHPNSRSFVFHFQTFFFFSTFFLHHEKVGEEEVDEEEETEEEEVTVEEEVGEEGEEETSSLHGDGTGAARRKKKSAKCETPEKRKKASF